MNLLFTNIEITVVQVERTEEVLANLTSFNDKISSLKVRKKVLLLRADYTPTSRIYTLYL